MRSSQQLKDLGIPTWYHEHARYYERLFGNMGWNEKQITEALKFGASYRGDGSEEHLTQAFREQMAAFAPDLDLAVDVGLGLRDSITLNGVESLPPIEGQSQRADAKAPEAVQPSSRLESKTEAGTSRMAEIRRIMRDDPNLYDRSPALQAEQLGLIEAELASSRPATAPTQTASVSSGTGGASSSQATSQGNSSD